jgi:hypothetical protein
VGSSELRWGWASLRRPTPPASAELGPVGLGGLAGRNTTRLALASDVPASTLAALTGTSIDNATDWANVAKRNWTDYAASRKDP